MYVIIGGILSVLRETVRGMKSYDLTRLSIMVVEDNAFMLKLVKDILRALGVRDIKTASDGADALRELRVYSPDIIILDWMMEPIDGIEFLKMLRTATDSANPTVPVIMLTGHTEIKKVLHARDTGANEFLTKPLSATALYKRIVSIIEHPRLFIMANTFKGPCRRRYNTPNLQHEERRSFG